MRLDKKMCSNGVYYKEDLKQSIKELIADEHINSSGEATRRIKKIFGPGLI